MNNSKKNSNIGLIITICILSVLVLSIATLTVLAKLDILEVPVISQVVDSGSSDSEPDKKPGKGGSSESENQKSGSSETEKEKVVGRSEGFHNFTADTIDILEGEEEVVTFSVEYDGKDDIGSEELAVYDENDNFIVYLEDNGKNGDEEADDGVYSGRETISADEAGGMRYHVSYDDEESAGMTVAFYRELTEDDFDGFSEVMDEISDLSFRRAKDFVEDSEFIKEFTIDEDSKTILYTTVYDITGLWHEDFDDDIKGSGAAAVPVSNGIDYNTAMTNLEQIELIPVVKDKDVAVVRPFRNDGFYYDDFRDAGNLIAKGIGGEAEIIDNGSANLDMFEDLGDYDVVLVDSHGLTSGNDSYIVLGEKFNAYSFLRGAYNDYIPDLVCGNIVFTNGFNLAVNGDFILRHTDPDEFEGSFWYLGICSGMANKSLSGALLDRGAYAVMGFTDSVYVQYCNKVLFEAVVNSMLLSADTMEGGFDSATKAYGKSDPDNSSCKLTSAGSGAFRIAKTEVIDASREVVLVLDVSGSMSGEPFEQTKNASKKFVETALEEDVAIGVVQFGSSAKVLSNFSQNEDKLKDSIDTAGLWGGTNTESGLMAAANMLKAGQAEKRIIVLMTDGEANEGKVGDELIAYADELKDDGILIYTLGFFHQVSNKASIQQTMEKMASEGCHYEVEDAEDLEFFFGDIADVITGQRYIYIRIACPVDVKVKHDGKTLSSAGNSPKTRTDFGTLTFEDIEDSEDRVKILRLKEGPDYDIEIEGTGKGKMDYTIQFMDSEGEYADKREFNNIDITKRTEIATVAKTKGDTVLKVDEDGDGRYDITYKAGPNERGEEVDYTFIIKLICGGAGALIFLIVFLIVVSKIKKRKRNPHPARVPGTPKTASAPLHCTKCGAKLDPKLNFCKECGNKIK